MFGSTSEQRLNMTLHQHGLVLFCSVDFHPSFEHVQCTYSREHPYKIVPSFSIHVDSSLYIFVSKVQYLLIKEGVSVENLQCAKVSRKSFQRQPGVKCLCRPSVNVTQQFYSCSASKDFGALMTSLSF